MESTDLRAFCEDCYRLAGILDEEGQPLGGYVRLRVGRTPSKAAVVASDIDILTTAGQPVEIAALLRRLEGIVTQYEEPGAAWVLELMKRGSTKPCQACRGEYVTVPGSTLIDAESPAAALAQGYTLMTDQLLRHGDARERIFFALFEQHVKLIGEFADLRATVHAAVNQPPQGMDPEVKAALVTFMAQAAPNILASLASAAQGMGQAPAPAAQARNVDEVEAALVELERVGPLVFEAARSGRLTPQQIGRLAALQQATMG